MKLVKNNIKRFKWVLIIVLIINTQQTKAQDGFPEPMGNTDQLFYLQRTSNKNTIVYELNKKNGVLNTEDPIHVFWIRYEEQSQRQELSFVQKRFAYGVRVKKIQEGHYRFALNSYDNFTMELLKDTDGEYRVYTMANNKRIQLQRIFIKITGGSMWSPDIEYFELRGYNHGEQAVVAERMKVLKSGVSKR